MWFGSGARVFIDTLRVPKILGVLLFPVCAPGSIVGGAFQNDQRSKRKITKILIDTLIKYKFYR